MRFFSFTRITNVYHLFVICVTKESFVIDKPYVVSIWQSSIVSMTKMLNANTTIFDFFDRPRGHLGWFDKLSLFLSVIVLSSDFRLG